MITRRLLRPSRLLNSTAWTCPACTQRTSFVPTPPQTSTTTTIRSISASTRRQKHSVPPLAFDETFEEAGVPGLFSRDGYNMAWKQYQSLLIQKLNELTAGEPIADKDPKDLALIFARDPLNAALFNHASMAFNNHFFFNSLSTAPLPLSKAPQLTESLVKTFGSIETLRATMIDTAASMFGPGFVWLVWARNIDSSSASRGSAAFSSRSGSWRLLTTYLAGTPFPEAGYRQQGLDMSNHTPNSYQAYLQQQAQIPGNTAGAFGPHSQSGRAAAKLPPGGTNVMPVLCVNTWQHVYLYDFGVAGKRQYLEKWWNAVDWGIVQERAPAEARGLNRFERGGGY
ncbi:putative manganese/iron superoxide dismutase [Septoria linicola]|nr:putative manganese/iron superoxide dismutase [Septoria linicola]